MPNRNVNQSNTSEFKTPEAIPRKNENPKQMRGEIPTMRECEKSNSDISGLSAFGPSIDRINNGGTHKKL